MEKSNIEGLRRSAERIRKRLEKSPYGSPESNKAFNEWSDITLCLPPACIEELCRAWLREEAALDELVKIGQEIESGGNNG